ncbi:perilipin-1 isoform X2 [Ascaphus truei]
MIMEEIRTKAQTGSAKENVIERFFQLAVVSSTVDTLQNKYANMKQVHPTVASVCHFYEKGVHVAGSLAVWSIQPLVKRLEHQIIAANDIACKGMDQLEQKIPALQYPPEKIALDLKESLSAAIHNARSGVSSPITSTADKVLGVASAGLDLTMSAMNGAADYAFSSRVSQMATEVVDLVLGSMEKLVGHLLPEQDGEPGDADGGPGDAAGQCEPSVWQPQRGPLPRIGALATRVFQLMSHWTSRTIQDTENKGQRLMTWVPGLAPQFKEPQSLLGMVAYNLQHVYLSTITSMKKAPSALWESTGGLIPLIPLKGLSIAKETLATLRETLLSSKDNMREGQRVKEVKKDAREIPSEKAEKRQRDVPPGSVQTDKSTHSTTRRSKQVLVQSEMESQGPDLQQDTAFEPEQPSLHKSAFSPYKSSGRKTDVEKTCTGLAYGSLYSTTTQTD